MRTHRSPVPHVYCGEHLRLARRQPSNLDASAGTVEELTPILERIWERWSRTQIVLRADSGFAREEILTWREANGIDYLLGLAENTRCSASSSGYRSGRGSGPLGPGKLPAFSGTSPTGP